MDRLGFDLDDGTSSASAGPAAGVADESDDSEKQSAAVSAQEARRRSIQTCLQSLVHACHCRDANCRLITCQKMKRLIQHSNACRRKNAGGCPVCKQLIALCCYHAKTCDVPKCPVPYCCAIREKMERQRAEQRLKQAQLMRRRMAVMQRGMALDETVPLTPQQPACTVFRDKNAQFIGMGHTVPVVNSHCRQNVQSPVYASAYHRTVHTAAVCDQQLVRGPVYSSRSSEMTVSRADKRMEVITSGKCLGPSETVTLQRNASVMNCVRMSSPATSYAPRQSQLVRIDVTLCHQTNMKHSLDST